MTLSRKSIETLRQMQGLLRDEVSYIMENFAPGDRMHARYQSVMDLADAVSALLGPHGQEAVDRLGPHDIAKGVSDIIALLPGLFSTQEDGRCVWDSAEILPTVSSWGDSEVHTALKAAEAVFLWRFDILGASVDLSRLLRVIEHMSNMEEAQILQGHGFGVALYFATLSTVPLAVAFEAAEVLAELRILEQVRKIRSWEPGAVPALQALCRKAHPASYASAAEYVCAEKWALELVLKHGATGQSADWVADLLRELRVATEKATEETRLAIQDKAETFDLRLVIEFFGRYGAPDATAALESIGREVLLQEKTPAGKISLRRTAYGGYPSPAAVRIVENSGPEARAKRIFVQGYPTLTRQLIDVAVVSAFIQLRQPYTSFLVPELGIVVADIEQAKRDAESVSVDGRISRKVLIDAYSSILATPGTACLAMALREYADVIAQSFVVAGVRGENLRRLMDSIYSDDKARKTLFTSESRRVGESITVLPEMLNFKKEVIFGIIEAEMFFGSTFVAPIVRNRMNAIASERKYLLARNKPDHHLPSSEVMVKEVLDFLEIIKKFREKATAESARAVVLNTSRKSTESWGLLSQVLDMIPTLVSSVPDEKIRAELTRSHPEKILATLNAILKKDPFETYKDKITPDEITRWERALANAMKPLLPLGFEVRVVVNGRELTGRFLERRDKRGIMLGEITDCCQCPRGVGNLAAWFGHEDPRAGYFVVTNAQGMILCMSMVWIDVRTNTVVFDNIEHNRFYGDNSKAIGLSIPVYQKMAELLVSQHGFQRVHCGCEHSEWTRERWEEAQEPIPMSPCSYTDARQQVDMLRPIAK